jgi:predicted secreted protein
MMKILSLMLMVALVASFGACTSQEKRSMDAMRGDCDAYEWDMRHELAIADGEAIAVQVFSNAHSAATPVSLNKKLAVSLYPTNEVRFVVEPEKRGKKAEEFAGLAKVRVDQAGIYRFSTAHAYWVEIVAADGKRIKSNKFEMQSQCKKVFKSAAFPLQANTDYWLQMSASRTKDTAIIITKEP